MFKNTLGTARFYRQVDNGKFFHIFGAVAQNTHCALDEIRCPPTNREIANELTKKFSI